jgi:hypothetical protein
LTLLGVGLGIAAAAATAPDLAAASLTALAGFGLTVAEESIVNTVAVAVSTDVISGGIEGFVNDVGNATGLGQYLNAIINNATGWNAGTIAPQAI